MSRAGWLLPLLLAVVSTSGATLVRENAELKLQERELEAVLPRGKTLKFSIEEQALSGYRWFAGFDNRKCEVKIEHRASSRPGIPGSAGAAEITVSSHSDDEFTVTLDYSRPQEREFIRGREVKVFFNTGSAKKAVEQTAGSSPGAAEFKGLPWRIPDGAIELKSGSELEVPVQGLRSHAELSPGEKLTFSLTEYPGEGRRWMINAVDAKVAAVKIVKHNAKRIFRSATAAVEVSALKAGRTLLEMSLVNGRDTPLRVFRCYIEVK